MAGHSTLDSPLRYSIAARNPAAHIFEVTVSIPNPDPQGQQISIPAWIPGSYMIRDLARHVVAMRAESDGQEVPLQKTDKSSWQAEPCQSELTFIAEIVAYDLSVRGAYLDTIHGFFDGACVFPMVNGREDSQCVLELIPPPTGVGEDWRVATSMRRLDAGIYEFGSYIADNYAELIDHPVEMGNVHIGEFEVCATPHTIAVHGYARFDMSRICHDLQKLCEAQIRFLGKPDNLDRYLFLLQVREKGYGGLEHCWSSSLMCSRTDLPRRGKSKISDGYRKFLGLCSHEYFHLWNVKRVKPECFTPYDLRSETHTGLLWVFEGITSYYDDLFLVRSGLISTKSYLELLGKAVTRVLRTRGRFKQNIEESSFDVWTKLYKQDANSPNSMISYYSKGALIALALDLTIRNESRGVYSLDDVMKECWRRFGESGDGMPERGFESLARQVTGLELEDFFERFVRGTGDLPLQGLFRKIGIKMHLRPASGSKDVGGKPAKEDEESLPWVGAVLVASGSVCRFSVVHSGGPAEIAGIAPGDEAVAIDGLRLTARNIDRRLRDYHSGDTVTVTVFRDHNLIRRRVTLCDTPEDTCYLLLDSDIDSETAKMRNNWLQPSK